MTARGARHSLRHRLLRKLEPDPNSGCWLWFGSVDDRGYGSINRGPGLGTVRTHRASYEEFRGPIPYGLVVMHKCDIKVCCNPDHLEVGTQAQNVRDAVARGLSGPRDPKKTKEKA